MRSTAACRTSCSIIEPLERERWSSQGFAAAAQATGGAQTASCSSAALVTALDGTGLIDYLTTHSTSCLKFLWDVDTNTPTIFTAENMQAVFKKIKELAPTYDGTNTSKLHQLWLFARIGYNHAWYVEEVGSMDYGRFNAATLSAHIAASKAFAASDHLYDLNGEAPHIMGAWLIAANTRGVREHHLAQFKKVLSESDMDKKRTAYWVHQPPYLLYFTLDLLHTGIHNTDPGLIRAIVYDDPDIVDALLEVALYDSLYPNNQLEYAVLDLGLLLDKLSTVLTAPHRARRDLSIDIIELLERLWDDNYELITVGDMVDDLVDALSKVLKQYKRLSTLFLMAAEGLEGKADCKALNICDLRSEVMALVLPHTYRFDDGTFVVDTSLSLDAVQPLYHAAKEVKAQFHRLLEVDEPVPGDTNEVLTIKLYGSKSDYEKFQPYLFDLDTDNGGIYIPEDSTFYTYERTPAESIYTLEELFRHEYVHYLQDRFLHPGQWNDTPIYQDCRLTWFDEGMAEFLVGSTQDEGIRVRRIVVKNIDSWGTSHHFNPTQIFNSCYWDGWDFYTYGGLFFNFAHEQRRTELLALLDEVRSGDTTAYDTRIKKWKDDTTLADDYDAFLDTQVSELKKGHLVDPTTTFPALGTLTTKSPTEIENALREIDSELNPVCDIAATKHNPRFECTDIVSASSGFSGDRGATNAHLSEQLDDLIVAAVDHKGGTINNFETMNCYFTDVDGSPPDANFSCEGPLAFEPGVTLSQTSLGVAENGGTGSYTLKLITQPTGNVTVTVSGEAGGALVHTAGGTPAATTTLTFTPDTYATEQTVTVTGVDDALVTPVDRTVTLTHTAVGGDYDSVATNNTVTVTLIDDEVTYCSPTPHNPQVARKYGRIDRVVFGAIDHFTGANADYSTYDTEAVVTPGSSVNLKVTVRSPSPSGNDWDPHTIYAWIDWNEDGEFASSERVVDEAIVSLRTDSAQTVTQSVAIPATVEPGQKRMRVRLTYWSYSGELGPCDNYWIGEIEDYNNIRVGVVEPGFRFSRTSLSVAENGGTGSYILALRTEPTGPVTVTVSGEAGGALVSTVGGTPAATTQLTFTPSNYDLAQTVLVTGVDDAVVNPADRTATLTHTAVGGGYDSVSSHNTVTVTLIDDDDGVLTLTLHLDSSSISENGGSSTVTATLSHPSSEAVSVTVSAPASDAYSLSANSTLSIAAGQTTSTGTVTLTAIDNALDAPDTQVTLSGTASGGNGVAHPASVTLTITDDDAVSVSIGVAPGTKVAYTDTVTLTAQVSDPAQVASYRWAHVGGYHKISTQQAVTLGGAKWPNSPGTRTFEVYVTLTDGSEVTARQSITFTKP